MRVAFTSACRLSAVTWRWPAPNRTRAKATRWRVGRRPAARKRAVKSGLVPDMVTAICKDWTGPWKAPNPAIRRFALTAERPYSAAAPANGATRTGQGEREKAQLYFRRSDRVRQ